jgi:signal transduction histidine kinase
MQEQLSHKQQALGAGIQMSDARRKRRSEEDSPGLVLQYDLIQGFLQKIGPTLAEYPGLHMFYFPVQSEQLLSVYRTADMLEPLPLELRPYLIITLAKARQLFNETLDARFLSSYHLPLENLTYQYGQNMVLDIIFSTLGGHLPYTHPKAATSLVICCPIPEMLAAASPRLRDLSGLLILYGDEQNFSQSNHSSLAKAMNKEFNRYLEDTGQYAAMRDLNFFLSSLISQDERIQDNQNRALGLIANMVVHRFRNFRQVAEFIVQEFPTAQEVIRDPDHYEVKIRAMKTQLNRAERLEKQLQYVRRAPDKTPITLGELVDIVEYVFNEMKEQTKSPIELEIDIPDSSRTELVLSPQAVIEEVFYNHLENMFSKIDQPDVENKKLSLRSRDEERLLCLDLINYGPAIAPDVLEDLQRLVRVRRPSGSGFGTFLSAMVMLHVGGDLEVISPIPGKDIGVCITFKFPRP